MSNEPSTGVRLDEQPRLHGLDTLFHPASIAVIGASSDELKIGGRPLSMLRQAGFSGPIYPINPNYPQVQGLDTYPSIEATPTVPELAIVAVPGSRALATARACAERGVKVVVLFSAGFAESGPEGRAQQRELTRIAAESGMRILGPNCIGAANLADAVTASFSAVLMMPRDRPVTEVPRIALVSQSGAIGGHCVALAMDRGFAFDPWLTTGNEADIDVADGIGYFASQENVTAIAVYLEGSASGSRLRTALQMAQHAGKPVIVLKSGTSELGALAAASHTASLVGSDSAYDVMFERYGVCRVHSIDALVDTSYALAHAGLPAGNRVAIFSGSGGGGILMADTATNSRLQVAPLSHEVQEELLGIWPSAGVTNPIDTTAQMTNDPALLPKFLDVVLDHGGHDMVLVFLTYVGLMEPWAGICLAALRRVRERHPDAAVLVSVLSSAETRAHIEALGMPCFPDLDAMVRTAGRLAGLSAAQRRAQEVPEGVRSDMPRLEPGTTLTESEAKSILADAGVPVVPDRVVNSTDDAVAAAAEFGYPVVLKVLSADIAHKSDIGGVELDLRDEAAVRAAYQRIRVAVAQAAPQATVEGVLVSPMIHGGIETILGVTSDPTAGMSVAVGLGGIHVEVFRDVSLRMAPVSVPQAAAMIREVRGLQLLDGLRGAEPYDIEALAEAVSALSHLAAANADSLTSIDVNPFVVLPQGRGGYAVDALIAPADCGPAPAVRRLDTVTAVAKN